MRSLKLFFLLLLTLVLAACQSVNPESNGELQAFDSHVPPDLVAHFLPPNGPNIKVTFQRGLDVEARIFALFFPGDNAAARFAFGEPVGPDYATGGGGISASGDVYRFNWDVSQSYANSPATPYLRVELRGPGAPEAPVCNTSSVHCLGVMDVRLVPNMGSGAQGTPEGIMNVNRNRTLPVRFVVEAIYREALDESASLGDLKKYAGQGTFEETSDNCVANEFGRPGQGLQAVGAGLQAVGAGLQAVGAGLQAVGAVGGLFSAPAESFNSTLHYQSPADTALLFAGALAGADSHGVVLLVVDDFGTPGTFELPTSLLDGDGDLLALAESGAVTHGAVVLHHLRQLAEAHFGGEAGSENNGSTDEPYFEYQMSEGPYLVIQAVNVAGLNTDEVPGAIRDAMSFLGGQGEGEGAGHQRVVVNMSFTAVPCTVLGDYSTSGLPTFESYVEALRVHNNVSIYSLETLQDLISALDHDALLTYLECPFGVGDSLCDGSDPEDYTASPIVERIIHVGASGNYGNDYALLPAAMPSVVSVGSQDILVGGLSETRSGYSNAAGVLAPGGLFLLSDGDNTTVYAGTSFAAPVVSLLLALDQMKSSPRWPGGGFDSEGKLVPHCWASDETSVLPLNLRFDVALNKDCPQDQD